MAQTQILNIYLYTNASKTDQGIGVADIIDDTKIKYKLTYTISAYRAETYAIWKELQLKNKTQNKVPKNYDIYTNS